VRVIAATNAPLQDYVASGQFRRDLFLPAQRLHDPPGAAPRAPCGHPAAGRTFPGGIRGAAEPSAGRLLGRRAGQAPGVRLPRQRPRAPLPGGASRHLVPLGPGARRTRPLAGRGRGPHGAPARRTAVSQRDPQRAGGSPLELPAGGKAPGHAVLDPPLQDAEARHHEVAGHRSARSSHAHGVLTMVADVSNS